LKVAAVVETQGGYVNNRVLRIQVGFLLNEGVGQSREYEFEVPRLRVAEDLMLNFLRGKLRMTRNSRGILVQGTLHTALEGECVRCLDETLVKLDVPIEELYVYPPQPDAEFNLSDDGIMDLAPLVREEIIIDTPMGILCKPDCSGLCPNCGENLNNGPCGCEREETDPRLAALKALRDTLPKN
jgi:uncharacterized protein